MSWISKGVNCRGVLFFLYTYPPTYMMATMMAITMITTMITVTTEDDLGGVAGSLMFYTPLKYEPIAGERTIRHPL